MADSTTHLPVIDDLTEDIIDLINALFDAASPAMTFGRNAVLCVGLTFAIFGGKKDNGTQIPTVVANQTFDCTAFASSTAYLYVDEDGIGTLSASSPDDSPSPAAGLTLVYTLVIGADTITSYTDHRTGAASVQATLDALVTGTEVGDNILLTRVSDGKQLLLGPFE